MKIFPPRDIVESCDELTADSMAANRGCGSVDDEVQRFLFRAARAAFFHLYGLNRDDTAYIPDTFTRHARRPTYDV